MKMVKSLLLGSAAGLVAVTAGQAADLPVKAKPVEYVKVCSLYGAGFYYIPGTDTCLKIGGYTRAELGWGYNGSSSNNPYNANVNDRATSNLVGIARGYITADARDMTAYGVARGYIAVGANMSGETGVATAETSNAGVSVNRIFVQWAGFTSGIVVSFYDFYSVPLVSYRGFIPASDTGNAGWFVPLAYTAQFGGGFSATLAAETRRASQIIGQTTADATTGTAELNAGAVTVGGQYGGWQVPDVVANLRVDQAWGSAQVMGALHEVNATYYAAPAVVQTNGHPGDKLGWAVGAGLRVNFPQAGPGDFFEGQVNYTVGAYGYVANGTRFNYLMERGAGQSFGEVNDCVYGGSIATATNTQCNLTTAWGFNVGYDHYYTNQWHQSLFGGWEAISYNTQANAILCSLIGGGNGAGIGTAAVATPGCNNNWDHWGVGSRLQWDVTKTFYFGVEVLWEHMDTATTFNGLLPATIALAAPGAPIFVNNENNWSATFRVHKDFYP